MIFKGRRKIDASIYVQAELRVFHSSAIKTLLYTTFNSAGFFLFFFFKTPFSYTFSLINTKLLDALELCKASQHYFHNPLVYKQQTHGFLASHDTTQQARGSGTGNRLATVPQLPDTFNEAKRQDNLAIIGLALTTLGTTASCLPASSEVP